MKFSTVFCGLLILTFLSSGHATGHGGEDTTLAASAATQDNTHQGMLGAVIDVSSSQPMIFGQLPNYVYTFPIPGKTAGFTGLSGSIALDLSQADFAEELLQFGFLPSCKGGPGGIMSQDSFNALKPRFFNAVIIKAATAGRTVMPVSLDFNETIAVSGCVYIQFSGDNLKASTVVQMINNLKFHYLPSKPTDAAFSTIYGPGGELCLGASGHGCLQASLKSDISYQSVTRVPQSGTLLQIIGSVSNAPYNAPGLTPVTGAWSTTNMAYLDPKCAHSKVGIHSSGTYSPMPEGSAVLLHLPLGQIDGNSVGQMFINQDVNTSVQKDDCIVQIRNASSTGVIDMETQLMFLFQPSS